MRADGYLLPRRATLLAMSGVLLGMLLAALNQTIVATALPRIVGDLGGMGHYSWVFTAYMLAATVTTPIYGRLSDVYGRRRFFVAGILIFMAGAVVCGTAGSMSQLVIGRAVQGLGAGALIPLAVATIGDLIPPVRARSLAGPDRRRVRLRLGHRADHRRLDLRPRRLALGVLRLAARRRRRARRGRRHAQDPAAPRARHQGRLRGRGPARLRPVRRPAGDRPGRPAGAVRDLRARARRLRLVGAPRRAADRPGRAVRGARLHRLQPGRVRGRRRHVRRDHVRAALRAGRDGRLGHRLRHRADAADAVDDDHQRRLGAGDHPHRPLPLGADRRPGGHGRRLRPAGRHGHRLEPRCTPRWR